jgi:hypothetical protein
VTSRRNFLKSSIVLGAGLVVGAEALEELARLTHVRKSFPVHGMNFTATMAEAQRKAGIKALGELQARVNDLIFYGNGNLIDATEFSGLQIRYHDTSPPRRILTIGP